MDFSKSIFFIYQVSVHPREDNKGYFLVMKGAPEGILSRCTSILINGETLQLTEEWKKNFDEEYEYLGGKCRCRRLEKFLIFCHPLHTKAESTNLANGP